MMANTSLVDHITHPQLTPPPPQAKAQIIFPLWQYQEIRELKSFQVSDMEIQAISTE
jgi:hypothetical protein